MLERIVDHRMRLNFYRPGCRSISGDDERASRDHFTLAAEGAISMIGDDGAFEPARRDPR
jgi:hypothetical protein